MFAKWSFGRRLVAGFAVVVALTIVIGVIGAVALQLVVASKDRVITVDGPAMISVTQMQTLRQTLTSQFRNFMLSGDPDDLQTLQTSRGTFDAAIAALRTGSTGADDSKYVDAIQTATGTYNAAVDDIVKLRQSGTSIPDALSAYTAQVTPLGMALSAALTDYVNQRQATLDASRLASTDTATWAEWAVFVVAVVAVLVAAGVAYLLTQTLNRQIGGAVGHVQSSSAELHSAANQQATSVKEQATSMSEISTTINELLATSRQIAESAQRVAQIAEQTATTARSGDSAVERASGSSTEIRQQTDRVVVAMLEVGRKSQQIGAVLDIVNELAEQTNILSINATIEAAGAGESGRRFSVVADEVRKLAERVGGSVKEIRALIEDMRSSVNGTIMATEASAKAADSGARQFAEVAASFLEISRSITTTTEAAREIELSTKQQATAVEQVNIAIVNVAQATRETEASAGQTIQTASELATTSRGLLRLVKSAAAAA